MFYVDNSRVTSQHLVYKYCTYVRVCINCVLCYNNIHTYVAGEHHNISLCMCTYVQYMCTHCVQCYNDTTTSQHLVCRHVCVRIHCALYCNNNTCIITDERCMQNFTCVYTIHVLHACSSTLFVTVHCLYIVGTLAACICMRTCSPLRSSRGSSNTFHPHTVHSRSSGSGTSHPTE